MGFQIPHGKRQFWGNWQPVIKYRDTAATCAKMAEPIVRPFGLWAQNAPRNHELDWVEILRWEGAIFGEGSPIVKYGDFLPWAVQKWLNRLIWCLGCGLGLAEGSTISIVFARWRQRAHIGGHIGAMWRIRFNCLRRRCDLMWSYVKLLWPLVTVFIILWSSPVFTYTPLILALWWWW